MEVAPRLKNEKPIVQKTVEVEQKVEKLEPKEEYYSNNVILIVIFGIIIIVLIIVIVWLVSKNGDTPWVKHIYKDKKQPQPPPLEQKKEDLQDEYVKFAKLAKAPKLPKIEEEPTKEVSVDSEVSNIIATHFDEEKTIDQMVDAEVEKVK